MRRAVAQFNGLLRDGSNRRTLQIANRLLMPEAFDVVGLIVEGMIVEDLERLQTLPEEPS
jgi:hypothetical protein